MSLLLFLLALDFCNYKMKFIWVYAFLFILLSITLLVEAEENEGSAKEGSTNEDTANKEVNNEDSAKKESVSEDDTKKTDESTNQSEEKTEEPEDVGGEESGGSNESSQNNEGSGSSNSANQGGGSSSRGGEGDKSKSDEEDADEGTIISNENEESHRRNRHFPKCKCLQRFRTSYLTGNVCGRAALCYWETWNYKRLKALAQGEEAFKKYNKSDADCDLYKIKKHTCLIGYPQPRLQNEACVEGLKGCEKNLSKILYDDCAPLREAYGLLKPQEVDWRIRTENLNYDMTQDKATVFRARPTPEHPKWNNYYAISCPVIYRYPYFTIDILLKDLDPNINYNETSALTGVAELIPRYAREGMNSERILNFDALSLDETYIHWCGIPRNYVCVRKELDPKRNQCKMTKKLASLRNDCETNTPNPSEKKSEKAAQDEHGKTKDESSPPREESTEPPKKETEKPKGKQG